MKTRTSRTSLFLSVGAASLVALGATAQTIAPSETSTPAAPSSEAAPPKLPYGVDDVLKLSRAQVSEDITLNYIHNSGTIYTLSPKDIVYLKDQGVSDKVVNAMIDQRQNAPADAANQNALQAQAAAAAAQANAGYDPNAVPAAPVLVQPPPFYVEAPPAYVPPEPPPDPPSTLYVIPYGATGYGYLPPYRSFCFGSGYGCGSTVYYMGAGYGGGHFYGGGHYHGGHGSTVYHFGRH